MWNLKMIVTHEMKMISKELTVSKKQRGDIAFERIIGKVKNHD